MLTPLPASASTTALMFSATVSGDALICWCIASLPHSRGSAWRGGTRPRTAHPTRASGPWEALDGRGLAPYWALGGVGSFTIRRARENGLGVVREGGAGDGVRTRDIQLGKLTLCQLSYSRSGGS